MTARRAFPRNIEALDQLFAFTAQALPEATVSAALRRSVDFVLEEYFTNIVKYGGGEGAIDVAIEFDGRGVEVTLTEPDARFFDVTQFPAADMTRPLAERQPGGLGLHLARRMVDTLRYEYAPAERRGQITFTIGIPPGNRERTGQVHDAGH
jgi:anti-sigma regulatory factor (Ser/Thr protein kinase)